MYRNLQCRFLWWFENIEDNNEDKNVGFGLFGTDDDEFDHKKVKWKYEPFFNFALIFTSVPQLQQKSSSKKYSCWNHKSSQMH